VIIVIISSLISTITSVTNNPQSALAAIQLLFINLVMNVFAALALATDKPTEKLLDRKPERRGSPLINQFMWFMILGQACYQLVVFFIVFLANEQIFGRELIEDGVNIFRGTCVYNTFVMQQLFNEVNCRSITKV
jgi:Ca2+-transporting ATPase